jgi:hypothetical protein
MRPYSLQHVVSGLVLHCVLVATVLAGGQSEASFTYQGQLKQNGVPTSETCDFEFALWTGDNAPDPGTQVGSTVQSTVEVRNGLFQVELDFGLTAFNGDARWLQVDVCCTSPCAPAFVALTPRQPLSATPYSTHTRGIDVDDVGNVGVGTNDPSQKLDVRGQLQVQDSIRLDQADEPMLVRQWDPMTSGRLAGFGRWGMFMEFENLFFGVPGSDFPSASSLRFGGWRADSTREDWMTIDKGGNVGIGTPTPVNKLDVTGGVAIGATYAGTSAAPSDGLIVEGSVSIGTSSIDANYTLHVNKTTGGCAVYGTSVKGNPIVAAPPLNATGVCANATSETSNVVGLRAVAESTTQWTTGVTAFALGTGGTNVGVRGHASGADTNWGGYFIGDGFFLGKVGIGTTTPETKLDVDGPIRSSGASGGSLRASNPNNQLADVNLSWDNNVARIRIGGSGVGGQNGLDIQTTGNTSLMRLLHNGNVGIGTQSPSARLEVWGSSTTPAIFNRLGNDGTLVSLKQDHSVVGSISVSGNTVSYNSFTGSHLGWSDEQPARGMLMTMTGENRITSGESNAETIYGMTTSSIVNDSKCFGAHLGLLEPTRPMSLDNPRLVMAVGNGDMWVVDTGRNLEPGDYLISSDVRGHAMLDDPEKFPIGYVVARVGQIVDWSKVAATVDGAKHQKISVFFENFERISPVAVARQVEIQQTQIDALYSEMTILKETISKLTMHRAGSSEVAVSNVATMLLVGILLVGWWRRSLAKQ